MVSDGLVGQSPVFVQGVAGGEVSKITGEAGVAYAAVGSDLQ